MYIFIKIELGLELDNNSDKHILIWAHELAFIVSNSKANKELNQMKFNIFQALRQTVSCEILQNNSKG